MTQAPTEAEAEFTAYLTLQAGSSVERPNSFSPAVQRRVAELLTPKVAQWLGDAPSEELTAEIVQFLDSGEYDGYHLAKEADDASWSPDTALVEIFDRASCYEAEVRQALTKEWVLENGITPAYEVGAHVHIPRSHHPGEIIRVDIEQARYLVFVEALGHVREGVGSHGRWVNYEDAKII